MGKVYLIGAGPGDPGLLGLKAKKILETADAVVYDRLADPRILSFAKEGAEMIYVGKKSAIHVMKQDDINRLLVKLAKEGKTVARLKGGDPFVFGRGGEEALELLDAGIDFDFIPGVTSAIAVAEYAGIPVTHRNMATSFAVIMGHEDPAKGDSSINWKGLATSVDTMIFLMGVENIEKITAELIKNGRSADCPAALIRWGTRPNQETLVTTVGSAAADAKKHDFKPPAIFIAGDVVKLRDKLRWFDKRPLFGKTIVVTRARDQSGTLTEKLEDLGAHVIEIPAIKIVPPESYDPLDNAINNLKSYKWLIFTSANGVKHFFSRLYDAGLDSRALKIKAAAIGAGTARALKQRGIIADIVPKIYKAEELAEALAPYIKKGDKILLPRILEAREVLPDTLRSLGAEVDVVPAYRTVSDSMWKENLIKLLEAKKIDMVTFTSSSTVTNLLNAIDDKKELLKDVKIAVIGPVTAATCRKLELTPAVMAEDYTIDGLVAAINKE
ncbi:MAG: uroporphyrinogen-III C-methyltransferase [Phascolarctobacterium sp.]|nr:uroporphyrinogen-III C-methyltransferase [Phascolarctobacterium sp.]